MSSLGCKDKERVGHLYRGRDCENNIVEDNFERMCYCRYHWCNHPDYYYGAAASLRGGPAAMAVATMAVVLTMAVLVVMVVVVVMGPQSW